MVQFSSSSVFASGVIGSVSGVSDLDVSIFGAQWKLFATNRTTGSFSTFDVMDAGGPAFSGETQAIAGGQFAATDLDIVAIGSDTFAVFSGAGNALHSAYDISVSGEIESSVDLAPTSGVTSALNAVGFGSIGGSTLMLTSQSGQAGFSAQISDADLTLTQVQDVSVQGGEIADVKLISLGNSGLAIAVNKAGNEILSYSVAGDGTLSAVGNLGVADGLGMIGPEQLRTVDVAGQHFGVVAASNSSSISVFEIADDGALTARDHVIDGQGTRFASISELEIIEANGRAFVLAAGADDGFTLLELMPDGRLLHHATLEDNNAISLMDVSGLTGAVQDGVLHVFAASATEAGLTEVTFDLGAAGSVSTAGQGDDTLEGGAGDDILFGGYGQGSDVLRGNGGDDVLVAGRGTDRLSGGAGADIFVFGGSPDGGQIEDFNVAKDILDLSGWFLLHDTSQLDFIAYGNRVDIGFQGYVLTIYSHDGQKLRARDVEDRITINPSHSMVSDAPEAGDLNDTLTGTDGDDVMFGTSGENTFIASDGADVYVGGGDFDVVTYENAGNRIIHDQLRASKNRGEVADDKLLSIEGVTGTDFNDKLKGSHADDWLEGREGDDVLSGRNGSDELIGGAGDDTIVGGYGNDTLEGGEGADLLKGGNNGDVLDGGAGNDTLDGGKGRDSIYGGEGNDKLTGSYGADTFHFTESGGRDKIMDFKAGADSLYIDDALLADPAMSAEEIIDTYGRDTGSSVLLDFGLDADGETQMVILRGVSRLDDLEDSLFVF